MSEAWRNFCLSGYDFDGMQAPSRYNVLGDQNRIPVEDLNRSHRRSDRGTKPRRKLRIYPGAGFTKRVDARIRMQVFYFKLNRKQEQFAKIVTNKCPLLSVLAAGC
jgi:hypothetical protein